MIKIPVSIRYEPNQENATIVHFSVNSGYHFVVRTLVAFLTREGIKSDFYLALGNNTQVTCNGNFKQVVAAIQKYNLTDMVPGFEIGVGYGNQITTQALNTIVHLREYPNETREKIANTRVLAMSAYRTPQSSAEREFLSEILQLSEMSRSVTFTNYCHISKEDMIYLEMKYQFSDFPGIVEVFLPGKQELIDRVFPEGIPDDFHVTCDRWGFK